MTVRLGSVTKSGKRGDREAVEMIDAIARAAGKPTREEQRASAAAVHDARRALWDALRASHAHVLARRLRARADDRDDNSNRLGVDALRREVADWLEAGARRSQTSLPLLSSSHDECTSKILRDLLRAGLRVDLVADRDGEVTMAAAAEVASESAPPTHKNPKRAAKLAEEWASQAPGREEVRRRLAVMRKALDKAIRANGRLVIAAYRRRYFVGDDAALSGADLLVAGLDGARRGLMDYQPSVAGPATHLLQWINQRMARTLEGGRVITMPSWVRDIASKARHIGCDLDLLRELLSMVEGLPVAADEEAGRHIAAVILDQFRLAFEGVDIGSFTLPALALRCALFPPERRHEAALAPLLAHLPKCKPANAATAIRYVPSRMVAEDDAPSSGEDEVDEWREAILRDQVMEALGGLRYAAGGAGWQAEAAEVIERLFTGVAEGVAEIAARPLACTGRKVSKSQVGELRDMGLAFLRRRLAPSLPVIGGYGSSPRWRGDGGIEGGNGPRLRDGFPPSPLARRDRREAMARP